VAQRLEEQAKRTFIDLEDLIRSASAFWNALFIVQRAEYRTVVKT
jgi:hypothetical protein